MIYTSYFGNLKNIGDEMVPIAICGKSPNWYHGPEYKKLAPKYKFFMEWKENHDNDFYIRHFEDEVLSKLDIRRVCNELFNLTGSKNIALVCYEKPGDFCHRHLVADWFGRYGVEVKEFE